MRGGSRRAVARAARRLRRRSSCSGQIKAFSQAASSSDMTSSGLRSRPARQTMRGGATGSDTGPVAAQRKTGAPGLAGRNAGVPPIVAVAVGQQAKAGRRAHFDQGKGLRQRRQQRQQDGAARGLVGLGGAPQHRGAKLVGAACDQVGQQRDIGRPPGDQGCGTQKQVRLASRRRKFAQEAQDIGQLGDVPRQALIVRRDSPGLVGRESAIAIARRASSSGSSLSHDHAKARPPGATSRPWHRRSAG